jgi:hypothetical protein
VINSTLSGNKAYQGGGISDDGTLNVVNSILSDNTALYGEGGGINIGEGYTLNVVNSTLSDNMAPNSDGGGIGTDYGTLTMVNSLISGNTAEIGGGIDSVGGVANLQNSTLSGNTALAGGGIDNDDGTLNIDNTTIAGNPRGGGILTPEGTTNLEATLMAGNSGGDCLSPVNDEGYNIDDDGSCGFSGTSQSDSSTLNASLGTLASNGGPTSTIALLGTSATDPAIDVVAKADCPSTDQRGAPRRAPCDIGAYDTDFPSFPQTCATGTVAYDLWASSSAGDFIGLFCLNAAGTGTYTQYSVPIVTQTVTGTGTVAVSGTSTWIAASGKGLGLLGQTTSTFSTFTETAPAPMKTGTFTLS